MAGQLPTIPGTLDGMSLGTMTGTAPGTTAGITPGTMDGVGPFTSDTGTVLTMAGGILAGMVVGDTPMADGIGPEIITMLIGAEIVQTTIVTVLADMVLDIVPDWLPTAIITPGTPTVVAVASLQEETAATEHQALELAVLALVADSQPLAVVICDHAHPVV